MMQKGFTDENITYVILASLSQMPGSVHVGMFMKCVDILGTDKQR